MDRAGDVAVASLLRLGRQQGAGVDAADVDEILNRQQREVLDLDRVDRTCDGEPCEQAARDAFLIIVPPSS